MKKFMNEPAAMAAESLAGFAAAHRDAILLGAAGRFVRRRVLTPGKVAIISGGGAGHEPLHVGFVGPGMLDAACPGHMFTSPTPNQIVDAIKDVDQGAGVLLIVKNYDGDVMNFEMAAELAAENGHSIRTVLVADDVSIPKVSGVGRRGVAGTLVVEKIVGAAAEAGWTLDALAELGGKVVAATKTMGVALKGATLPTASRESIVLGETDMEIGVGIHGEPGGARVSIRPAASIVTQLCERIGAELDPSAGNRMLLFVNGLGGTPLSELYLTYGLACDYWTASGFAVERSLVGSFVTSLDMHGLSITVAILDPQLEQFWDSPVHTTALRW
jgi:dihydroxyacetone kinase-like protein